MFAISQIIDEIGEIISQQHVSATDVRPNHEVKGESQFYILPESISFEILTRKFAQGCRP